MFTKLKFCKSCSKLGTFSDGSPGCIKFKIKVNPTEDYCKWHKMKTDPIACEVCKRSFSANELSYWYDPKEEKGSWVCAECLGKVGTCATCFFQSDCGFAMDHSEPQVVMQNVQKGFMTMQTQVKNPHLVQKH